MISQDVPVVAIIGLNEQTDQSLRDWLVDRADCALVGQLEYGGSILTAMLYDYEFIHSFMCCANILLSTLYFGLWIDMYMFETSLLCSLIVKNFILY